MNLPKAKQILELNIKEAGKQMPTDTLTAVKLGSQAISRLSLARSFGDKHCQGRLPDEDAVPIPTNSFRMIN